MCAHVCLERSRLPSGNYAYPIQVDAIVQPPRDHHVWIGSGKGVANRYRLDECWCVACLSILSHQCLCLSSCAWRLVFVCVCV